MGIQVYDVVAWAVDRREIRHLVRIADIDPLRIKKARRPECSPMLLLYSGARKGPAAMQSHVLSSWARHTLR